MKTKPDPNAVLSELSRDSVFFQRAVTGAPAQPESPVAESSPAEPTATAVRPVPSGRPARRKKVRHPFDIYDDQLESLRELSTDDRRLGGQGSMSEMVREALEQYLPAKKGVLREALERYFAEQQEQRR